RVGCKPAVESLILGGASANVANRLGQTPLMLAVRGGHVTIVRLLLFFGAADYWVDVDNKSALDLARDYEQREIVNMLLRNKRLNQF
uniref:ankyrin repeat domain-containing protein n=1 Tax=uncultured Kiloniella sp. TaxID=1133091 RepID=UPI002637013A